MTCISITPFNRLDYSKAVPDEIMQAGIHDVARTMSANAYVLNAIQTVQFNPKSPTHMNVKMSREPNKLRVFSQSGQWQAHSDKMIIKRMISKAMTGLDIYVRVHKRELSRLQKQRFFRVRDAMDCDDPDVVDKLVPAVRHLIDMNSYMVDDESTPIIKMRPIQIEECPSSDEDDV
jgi:hypothetical protein